MCQLCDFAETIDKSFHDLSKIDKSWERLKIYLNGYNIRLVSHVVNLWRAWKHGVGGKTEKVAKAKVDLYVKSAKCTDISAAVLIIIFL